MQCKPCKSCKHHRSMHSLAHGTTHKFGGKCSVSDCPCRAYIPAPQNGPVFDGPVPSLKTLAQVTDRISTARVIRSLLTGVADPAPYLSDSFKSFHPYNETLDAYDRVLEACNTVLGAHGVEPLRDGKCRRHFGDVACLYLNMGDTYTATLLYNTDTDRIHVTSWGDYVERHEKQFRDC